MIGLAGCGGNGGGDTDSPTPEQTETDDDVLGDDTPTETPTPTPEPADTATPERLGDTLVGPDGEQVTLQLVYSTGSETTETQMQLIQQLYGQVGINVELTGTQFNSMLANYASNKTEDMSQEDATFNAGSRDEATSAREWDLMGGIGFNSYPRTPPTIRSFWTDERKSAATTNFYGYRPSTEIGPLIDEAASATDPEVTQENLAQLFGVLSEDQPVNFLTFSTVISGYRDRVSGFTEEDVGPSFGFDDQTWYFGNDASVGGTYITGDSTGATSLNFIQISDQPSANRVSLTLDGAYTLNNENEVVPRWVEDYDVKDGQQTFEFFLRDNLQWSEEFGQMTADDWVYWMQEVHQAEDNWAGDTNQSNYFRNEEPIPVEKTGDLSFEFQLSEPDPFFLQRPIMWAEYCMPQGLLEEYRDAENGGQQLNEDERVQTLAYTGNLGPYEFERWDRNSVFVATRNDDYYARNTVFDGDVPYFEEEQYQVFGEEATRLSALEAGDITTTGLPANDVQRFVDNDEITVVRTPDPFCGMLVYNQRANGWEQLRNRQVRQALSTAVNKVTITEDILRGNARIAYTHQPQYSDWYDESQVTRFGGPNSHGIGRAQRLLDEALPDGYEFQ
jgi:peptide/nickel transport system substrate-binding protein